MLTPPNPAVKFVNRRLALVLVIPVTFFVLIQSCGANAPCPTHHAKQYVFVSLGAIELCCELSWPIEAGGLTLLISPHNYYDLQPPNQPALAMQMRSVAGRLTKHRTIRKDSCSSVVAASYVCCSVLIKRCQMLHRPRG